MRKIALLFLLIALRLQPTGMRKPWDGAVYEAAREFIMKECRK